MPAYLAALWGPACSCVLSVACNARCAMCSLIYRGCCASLAGSEPLHGCKTKTFVHGFLRLAQRLELTKLVLLMKPRTAWLNAASCTAASPACISFCRPHLLPASTHRIWRVSRLLGRWCGSGRGCIEKNTSAGRIWFGQPLASFCSRASPARQVYYSMHGICWHGLLCWQDLAISGAVHARHCMPGAAAVGAVAVGVAARGTFPAVGAAVGCPARCI
jgi:hypothetical protein